MEGFHLGQVIHCAIVSRALELDAIVGNTLVDFYAKFGSMNDAMKVFGKLSSPNVVSWGALLAGYAQQKQGNKAFELFTVMLSKGIRADNAAFSSVAKACACSELVEQGRWVHEEIIRTGLPSDVAVGNALIEMYVKCECIKDARKVFDAMPDRDVVSWNLMLTAYTQSGQDLAVLELFATMQHTRMQPNEVTFLVLLKVCGNLGALAQLRLSHNQIVELAMESELVLGNSLIDMYAKCGSIEDSQNTFDGLKDQDEVSWGAIISGHAQHGNCRIAGQCLEVMQQQGMKPNTKIYTSILSGCSQAGEIEEGQRHFKSMKSLSLTPTVEHYNCMIDLLGRAGFLKEGKQILDTMPVSPDATGWMSLLASSRAYSDVKMGRQCIDQIVLLDEDLSAGYVLMSNLWTETDNWEGLESLVDFSTAVV
jgi:pentatricopeptide repeat protein